jgi:hypothetical protein
MAAKTLKLRRADVCSACGATLAAGATATWDSTMRTVTCIACQPQAAPPGPRTAAGEAGASAAREHERRAQRELTRKVKAVEDDAAWRAAVTAERPILGRVRAAMKAKPTIGPESQATKAWAAGAAGERRVAEILDSIEGIRALHDRRIPRSKANIDHLAIGPAGIYVIDAKKYVGKVEKRDKGSWLRADVRLYVNGRDRSKLVAGVVHQLEVVQQALEAAGIVAPVRGVLCFVGGEWPVLFRRPLQFGSVTALWPTALGELVSTPGALVPAEVERVAVTLAAALSPA